MATWPNFKFLYRTVRYRVPGYQVPYIPYKRTVRTLNNVHKVYPGTGYAPAGRHAMLANHIRVSI